MAKLKVGVIGLGTNGTMHLKQIAMMPEVDIAAVSDVLVDQKKELLDGLAIDGRYKDYHELLALPGIDAVFLFTPTGQHVTMIKEAAQAGKHIFCEKPLAKDDSEEACLEALREVKKAGVQLQIAYNRRFDPQFREVYEKVRAGQVGDPQIVKVVARDPFVLPYEWIKNSGGLLQDFTAHDFDMARYQMGSDIVEVFVKGATLIDPELRKLNDVDTLAIVCEFANGGFGLIDESRKAVYGYDQRVEVFGSEGMVKAENVNASTVELYNDKAVELKKPLPYYLDRFKDAYIIEKQYFVDSLLNGTPIVCTGEDAFLSLRTCRAAQQSLETGLPVKVNTKIEY